MSNFNVDIWNFNVKAGSDLVPVCAQGSLQKWRETFNGMMNKNVANNHKCTVRANEPVVTSEVILVVSDTVQVGCNAREQ